MPREHVSEMSRGGVEDGSAETSFFKQARSVRIKNSSLMVNNFIGVSNCQATCLHKLSELAAPNAILNAGGRAEEEVRCHPGTREEVIAIIERWMSWDDPTAPSMFWLSGPAGAGKSAIVQTIAERCKGSGVAQANFFFFRSDSTRFNASALVATLLYQIWLLYPSTHQAITRIIAEDPLIFQSAILNQFQTLISGPLNDVECSPQSPSRRPIVLLIDGLDECAPTSVQGKIIRALDNLLCKDDAQFLVLFASRAEPQISMTFKQVSSPCQTMFLDEKYLPEADIRVFVNAEFHKIRESHPLGLAGGLDKNWPAVEDVESIVKKSSGQFIFSATVMRFISTSSASPQISLQRIQGIVPPITNSPFAQLDAIYHYVLRQADDKEAVLDLLTAKVLLDAVQAKAKRIKHLSSESRTRQISFPVRKTGHFENMLGKTRLLLQPMTPYLMLLIYNRSKYTKDYLDSCVSPLTSILRVKDGETLSFYHASMNDFLLDQSRSGQYFADRQAFLSRTFAPMWKSCIAPSGLGGSRHFIPYALILGWKIGFTPGTTRDEMAMAQIMYPFLSMLDQPNWEKFNPLEIRGYFEVFVDQYRLVNKALFKEIVHANVISLAPRIIVDKDMQESLCAVTGLEYFRKSLKIVKLAYCLKIPPKYLLFILG